MNIQANGLECENESDSSALIYLDPRIYSREAILRAAYWFTNIAFIKISPSSTDSRIVVQVRIKESRPTLETPEPAKLADVIGEFCNSLLDFELRRQVETETAGIRQLILAKAFSESGILEDEPPGPISDPVEKSHPGSFTQIIGQT